MDRTPPVSLVRADDDVIGTEPEDRAPRPGRSRVAGLGLVVAGAAIGFAVAQAVPARSSGGAGPALTLVAGRSPDLDVAGGDEPQTTMTLTLVNTGASTVRLQGATVAGSELEWQADRSLQQGQQVAAVLREQRPCERASDVLSGGGRRNSLRVRLESPGRDGADVLSLALPQALGRAYDDHVRDVCKLPRLPAALEVVQGSADVGGAADVDAPVLAFDLQNLSVHALRVLEIAPSAPGVTATLTDDAGRPVELPLQIPARTRQEIAQGLDFDESATAPYRLRLTLTPEACSAIRSGAGGEESVGVSFVDVEDPRTIGTRSIVTDLTGLFPRCRPAGG